MKKIIAYSIATILLAGILITSCKKDDSTKKEAETGYDRGAMLTNYADNYIVPAYADIVNKLTKMNDDINAFTANPNTVTLGAARTSFEEAYRTWQKVEMLEFGPAEDVSLRMYTNIYPTAIFKLNNTLINGNYNLEEFGNKDIQGLPAIDFLLNGMGTDNEHIANYTSESNAIKRGKYLNDLSSTLLKRLAGVKNAWGSYRSTFVAATGTDVNSSLSKMVNAYVLYYERYLRSGKIGLPVGAMTGVANPDLTERYFSPAQSKAMITIATYAVLDFYNGKGYNDNNMRESMKTYLTALGTKDDNGELIADIIAKEIRTAAEASAALNSDIKTGVTNNRSGILTMYQQYQKVVPLIKVDMVSAFGISITYVDNDGD